MAVGCRNDDLDNMIASLKLVQTTVYVLETKNIIAYFCLYKFNNQPWKLNSGNLEKDPAKTPKH